MNLSMIRYILGNVLAVEGLLMAPCSIVGYLYGEAEAQIYLIIGVCSYAQSGAYGAYSPYSIYGIGEISKQGTAYNKSMGGVGIASRNKRFINC